nr:MAG TPA: hypothetical protein [Caudoviricetes sp.]
MDNKIKKEKINLFYYFFFHLIPQIVTLFLLILFYLFYNNFDDLIIYCFRFIFEWIKSFTK